MQDFGTKADNSPPPGGQLSAAEFNNLATENENAVSRSGQTLSGASATQLATSLFLHGVKSTTFQDSGAANAYVVTPVSGTSGVLLPADYTTMNGAVILFKASNANTTAATLNIGQTTGTLLGTKAIVDQAGAVITSGAITASYTQLRYDSSIGAGSWVLMPWSISRMPSALNIFMSIPTASASATLTADTVTLNTTLGGQTYQIALFSKAINLATTGAGGMDTGTAPVSGYVALYAIYNPAAGTSALLATNATSVAASEVYAGANMPAGYTASALLSVTGTNASSQFRPIFQRGRKVSFDAINVLTSVLNQSSFVSLSMAVAVPLNAISCSGTTQGTSSTATLITTQLAANISGWEPQQMAGSVITQIGVPFKDLSLLTPQTIYRINTVGAGTPGWSINVVSYVF